jgi:hypothetical protein
MADIWPIENVWDYIKEKLSLEEIENLPMLKNKVIDVWRTITIQICSKLIISIPRRLQCLINKGGYTINKPDCNDLWKLNILF